jgi:hypothetical protein
MAAFAIDPENARKNNALEERKCIEMMLCYKCG